MEKRTNKIDNKDLAEKKTLLAALLTGACLPVRESVVPYECVLTLNLQCDCNSNGVLDEDDITYGTSADCQSNGTPDECEPDCNNNGTPDDCESFADCNDNGVPDDCELTDNDCNSNGPPDDSEPDCKTNQDDRRHEAQYGTKRRSNGTQRGS